MWGGDGSEGGGRALGMKGGKGRARGEKVKLRVERIRGMEEGESAC